MHNTYVSTCIFLYLRCEDATLAILSAGIPITITAASECLNNVKYCDDKNVLQLINRPLFMLVWIICIIMLDDDYSFCTNILGSTMTCYITPALGSVI